MLQQIKIPNKPQSLLPKLVSPASDCYGSSFAREGRQPAQITKDYIWWCAVYHGTPLSADDPAFYHKAAIILAVMAGISLPEFVIEILNKTLPAVTNPLSEGRREINEEIIRKLETVRRMASNASRRTFALQTAEIVTTLYKILHDIVATIPDEEMKMSMTDLSANTWGQRSSKSPPGNAELQMVVDTSSFAALGNPSLLPDTGSLWTVKPISIISRIPDALSVPLSVPGVKPSVPDLLTNSAQVTTTSPNKA